MIGKTVLNYTIQEKIGTGGFGTVYKCVKVNPAGTYVRALKHISLPTEEQYYDVLNSMGGNYEKADDYFSGILKDIVSEIQILNNLSECGVKNVVTYYENHIEESGFPRRYNIYILMEYLTVLTKYMRGHAIAVKDVIQLGRDISVALQSCHENGIIHRDIKDSNIFVAQNGMFKLGDFGVSKVLRDRSRAETMAGTLNFIAPEVYLGKEQYDCTVDIYSLGIVLYRLLNYNRNPFMPQYPDAYTSRDEEEAFAHRMKKEKPDLPANADNRLGETVVRALLPSQQRYKSAEEFLDELYAAECGLSNEELNKTVIESLGNPAAVYAQTHRNRLWQQDEGVCETVKVEGQNAGHGSFYNERPNGNLFETVYEGAEINENEISDQNPNGDLSGVAWEDEVKNDREESGSSLSVCQDAEEESEQEKKTENGINETQYAELQVQDTGDAYTSKYGEEVFTVYTQTHQNQSWQQDDEICETVKSEGQNGNQDYYENSKENLFETVQEGMEVYENEVSDSNENLLNAVWDNEVKIDREESKEESEQKKKPENSINETQYIESPAQNMVDAEESKNVSDWLETAQMAAAPELVDTEIDQLEYNDAPIADRTVMVAGAIDEDGWNYSEWNIGEWKDIISIFSGGAYTIGLLKDGSVVAVGNRKGNNNENWRRKISNWRGIDSVACGVNHTVGLRKDGKAVAVHSTGFDVGNWKDIISISCGFCHTVGLQKDGIVMAEGYNFHGECDVGNWKDIISICCGFNHTVGLRKDGTVMAVGYNRDGECDVAEWKDIISISCGMTHTVGLRKDGTVMIAGYNGLYDRLVQRDIAEWKDIISICCGASHTAGLRKDGTVVVVNAGIGHNASGWKNIISIYCGHDHTIGLRKDGTVVAAGNSEVSEYGECNVGDWTNIISISCGEHWTVGLKNDGTVMAVGDNEYGQCDVGHWEDIISIFCGEHWTVGLRKDGTVMKAGGDRWDRRDVCGWKDIISICCGDEIVGLRKDSSVIATGYSYKRKSMCYVDDWRNLVAVACGWWHTVGLRENGTVVAVGSNDYGQCDINTWRDIICISCGDNHTVGVRKDGIVVAVGNNEKGQCDVTGWQNIVSISCGTAHTVGLQKDGTVVAVGDNEEGQCNVTGWQNIVSIFCGTAHTVGLQKDGTVVAVGDNEEGQCDVSEWQGIKSISCGNWCTVGLQKKF